MYVVFFISPVPPTAFARGQKLVMSEDAPAAVRGLQTPTAIRGGR